MADFYVDHGAYGLVSNRIGLDAPTWGVPQEGDGYSKDAATISAVAEIQIIASPTASETLVIAGATITAAAALGTNTFARGATPSDTATNVVALINSANFTATVSTSVVIATNICPLANQGRNLFYARVKPAATDTVQIMWRIGSVALNHATNSLVAITSSGWASAPSIVQFIGGTSGCWGWFANPTAVGQASSLVVNAYGVWFARPTVVRVGSSSAGALTVDSLIWLRTANGQTCEISYGGGLTMRADQITLIADSNLQWTGDSGTGQFIFRCVNTSGFSLGIPLPGITSGTKCRIMSVKQGGLQIHSNTTGAGTLAAAVSGNVDHTIDNLTFTEDPAGTAGLTSAFPLGGGSLNASINITRCIVNMLKASAVGRSISVIGVAGGYVRNGTVRDCEFNFNFTGSSNPTVALFSLVSSHTGESRYHIHNCKITGLGAYYQPVFSASAFNGMNPVELIADNVAGSLVSSNGLAPWVNRSVGNTQHIRRIFISNPDLGGSWKLENCAGAADWILGAGFPTLAGVSPGGTAMSVRIFWLPTPTGQDIIHGFTTPQFRQQSRGATGTKTITFEFLVPTAITFDLFNMRFSVSYVDNTGALRNEVKTGADLVSSAASWNGAGGYPNHTAKKITLATAYQIKQWTDVVVDVTLYGNCPTGSLEYVFFDPGYVPV